MLIKPISTTCAASNSSFLNSSSICLIRHFFVGPKEISIICVLFAQSFTIFYPWKGFAWIIHHFKDRFFVFKQFFNEKCESLNELMMRFNKDLRIVTLNVWKVSH